MKLRIKEVFLFSPWTLSVVSLAFFLTCWVFPPQAYEAIMRERNLIFIDVQALTFYLGCLTAFWLGLAVVPHRDGAPTPSRFIKRSAILIPLAAAVTLNAFSLSILLKNNPWMFTGWFTDAAQVKKDYDATGGLSEALPLLFAVCWWALFRTLERKRITGKSQAMLTLAVILASCFAMLTALMKAARYDLMPGVVGLLVVFSLFAQGGKRFNALKLAKSGLLLVLITVLVFSVLAYFRGATDKLKFAEVAMGYSIASYNRLSAVLSGDIVLPYGGTGTYTFRFLSHIPLLHGVLDLREALGMPEATDVLMSEFPAVEAANLSRDYIWLGTFGYIFSDIGFWVFPYVFVLGAFTGLAWRSFRKGSAFGLVLFPWTAFCVLFWFGSNFFPYPRLVTFLVTATALTIYEFTARRAGLLNSRVN